MIHALLIAEIQVRAHVQNRIAYNGFVRLQWIRTGYHFIDRGESIVVISEGCSAHPFMKRNLQVDYTSKRIN